MQPLSNVDHFSPFISTIWLVSANFENMHILGLHSAGNSIMIFVPTIWGSYQVGLLSLGPVGTRGGGGHKF